MCLRFRVVLVAMDPLLSRRKYDGTVGVHATPTASSLCVRYNTLPLVYSRQTTRSETRSIGSSSVIHHRFLVSAFLTRGTLAF